MKYLIEDTDRHTLGEINDYLRDELFKTSLVKSEIKIEDSLKEKIGTMEVSRILDENGMAKLYQIDLSCMHLNVTGNTIEFTKNEIQSRFENAFDCILSGILNT